MAEKSFADALNEQIANEFAASQQYVGAAVYYDAETLPRLAAFFYRQALEEREHAMMMVQYLLDVGEEVHIPDIKAQETSYSDGTTPVKSDVPVLILSGGLDPVTPPANGAEVAKSLPASRHIVARGYGHIVSPHACGPRLIAAFIDDPTFETLPASCIEHFEKSRRPPVWPDRLGARS